MTGVSTDLSSRYGTAPRTQRVVVIGVSVLLVTAFLVWVVWAAVSQGTPSVTSELASFKVVDAHRATAVVEVDLDGDAKDAQCRVQAVAADHSVVGELTFSPVDGRNEVSIRTEREATSVAKLGCTAQGQSRPR
jgi:type II secretory pathway component PulM